MSNTEDGPYLPGMLGDSEINGDVRTVRVSTMPERAEELARMFHETYERLAPSLGYFTRPNTREFDPATPNGRLMVAVCAELRLVPESRLLAAEARLREVEWKRLEEQRQYNADWTALRAENTTLRAERDALVPLARFGLMHHDLGSYHGFAVKVGIADDSGADTTITTHARAILAREAGA